ncbi:MAG: substrate-binding domain-containing protein [Nocardiopsaceae bacterium]|nr:substrate-binding domain-containing protein [Nocardiopsaceae bacterium]
MHTTAIGVLAGVDKVIANPLFAGLIVAAAGGVVGLVWRSFFREFLRFGWKLLYDAPINQDRTSSGAGQVEDGRSSPTPTPWAIEYGKAGPNAPPYTVRNGSLVAIEMKNIGRLTIRESDFGNDQFFRIRFPGRKVVHYKVRGDAWYHDRIHNGNEAPPAPGADNFFNLPALQVNPGRSFNLLVLLEAEADPPPGGYEKPLFEGSMQFVEFGQRRRGLRTAVAALGVLVLGFGGFIGAQIANGAQSPAAVCASGNLTIAGSTAFAPVFNQVVTEYEQDCPDAHITVNPDGSGAGLDDLTGGRADIAMYDGTPPKTVGPQFVSRKAGDVIFAVVGNQAQSGDFFRSGPGGGLTPAQIAQAFSQPGAGHFSPVGREAGSGTRLAFQNDVLNGDDTAEDGAPSCPAEPSHYVPGKLCLAKSTLQLLSLVNDTKGAIGYAEADALPFFPNVREIPIGGYEPTRGNVLNGDYRFLATERLYTKDQPSALATNLINFLTSGPVTAQLRATSSFIACADLTGKARGRDCQGS